MPEDYYEILGVERGATDEEIKKAFRKKAHELHPDKPNGDAEKFKKANEAYQVLSNADKRKQYDQFGKTFDQAGGGPGGGGAYGGQYGNFDFNDLGSIFGDLFGGGGRRGRQQERGADIGLEFLIDLEEAYRGLTKNIEYPIQAKCDHCKGNLAEPGTPIKECKECDGKGEVVQTRQTMLGVMQQRAVCPACKGQGKIPEEPCKICHAEGRIKTTKQMKIKIPAGINDEHLIRVNGAGNAGPHGTEAGDLLIRVGVRESDKFERDGADIYSEFPVTFTEAALGATKNIDTLAGDKKLKIPTGTQSGTKFRITNAGMPFPNQTRTGDHYAIARIVVPKKVSAKEKELLEQLSSVEKQPKLKRKKKGLFR
ncbi:molecular chaperone DnaJ [Patescibacteria group bacterium]